MGRKKEEDDEMRRHTTCELHDRGRLHVGRPRNSRHTPELYDATSTQAISFVPRASKFIPSAFQNGREERGGKGLLHSMTLYLGERRPETRGYFTQTLLSCYILFFCVTTTDDVWTVFSESTQPSTQTASAEAARHQLTGGRGVSYNPSGSTAPLSTTTRQRTGVGGVASFPPTGFNDKNSLFFASNGDDDLVGLHFFNKP